MADGPGRPPIEATPELLQKIEGLSGIGLDMESIGNIVGISRDTLRVRPEFSAAIKNGRDKGVAEALEDLKVMRKNGNFQAAALYIRAFHREKELFREKTDLNVSGTLALDSLIAEVAKKEAEAKREKS